jgi:hypothetical protein
MEYYPIRSGDSWTVSYLRNDGHFIAIMQFPHYQAAWEAARHMNAAAQRDFINAHRETIKRAKEPLITPNELEALLHD